MLRAQVLAGEGQVGLVHGVHGGVDEAFDVAGGGVACHGDGAEGIDGGLDQHIGNGEQAALEACGETHAEDLLQLAAVDAQLLRVQVDGAVGAEEADDHQHHADDLAHHRGNGHARHAHVEYDHQKQVQKHIHDAGDRQVIQGTAGVAHGAEDGGTEVVEHIGGHTHEVDLHIQGSGVDHVIRAAHEGQ